MTSNLILTFPKKLNLTKTVDSSELSSDSETKVKYLFTKIK